MGVKVRLTLPLIELLYRTEVELQAEEPVLNGPDHTKLNECTKCVRIGP